MAIFPKLRPVPNADFSVPADRRPATVLGVTDAPFVLRTVESSPVASKPIRTPLAKSPGRRRFFFNRDSQAQRLRIGNPNSRRRRRYDNDHFVDHPLVDPENPFSASDIFPGPPMPRPRTVFSVVKGESVARVMAATPESASPASTAKEMEAGVKFGVRAMTRCDRKIRKDAKRWVDRDVVAVFEEKVVEFLSAGSRSSGVSSLDDTADPTLLSSSFASQLSLSPSPPELSSASSASELPSSSVEFDSDPFDDLTPGKLSSSASDASFDGWVTISAIESEIGKGWVRVRTGLDSDGDSSERRRRLVLVIDDAGVRSLVHMLSRYYALQSESETGEMGERLTFIYSSMDDGGVTLPDVSFTEFLFSNL